LDPRYRHDGRRLAQQPPSFPSSARQGFFWWEFDLTYYVLRGLELLGLVWDLQRVPDELLAGR